VRCELAAALNTPITTTGTFDSLNNVANDFKPVHHLPLDTQSGPQNHVRNRRQHAHGREFLRPTLQLWREARHRAAVVRPVVVLRAAPGAVSGITVASDAGRRDTRLAVVSGLRYDLSKRSARGCLPVFENRQIERPGKNSDRYTVGASLDFNVDFVRPRWPAGR